MKSLTRKFLLLSAAAVLVAGPALRADDPKPEAPRGERRGPGGPNLQALAEELGLSAEQKAQLEPIMKAQAEKRRALRDDQSLTREQRMEKMRAIMEEGNKAISAVLTPEQMAKYKEMQAKMRGGPGGPRGDRPQRDKN